jgi:hypothetical protein
MVLLILVGVVTVIGVVVIAAIEVKRHDEGKGSLLERAGKKERQG